MTISQISRSDVLSSMIAGGIEKGIVWIWLLKEIDECDGSPL